MIQLTKMITTPCTLIKSLNRGVSNLFKNQQNTIDIALTVIGVSAAAYYYFASRSQPTNRNFEALDYRLVSGIPGDPHLASRAFLDAIQSGALGPNIERSLENRSTSMPDILIMNQIFRSDNYSTCCDSLENEYVDQIPYSFDLEQYTEIKSRSFNYFLNSPSEYRDVLLPFQKHLKII